MEADGLSDKVYLLYGGTLGWPVVTYGVFSGRDKAGVRRDELENDMPYETFWIEEYEVI